MCLAAATVTVGEGLEAALVVPFAATGLKVGLRPTGAGLVFGTSNETAGH